MTTTAGPLRIQLAIQGGGARIFGLVAVLEAVESLEAQELIKVTRVAGTSAGAIVGSLFAAGVRMDAVRQRLGALTLQQLREMFPPPSRWKLLTSLGILGIPLWKTEPIEKILKALFESKGAFDTLGSLAGPKGIDVVVVAADLRDSGKVVYRREKKLINSLLDSCALPYCFRTWDKGGNPVIVDGGICANLPSEELEENEEADGTIVGITFRRPGVQRIRDVFDFSKALLDTAINSSIDRARFRLGGRVFSIDTEISTFDFQRALEHGFRYEYNNIRDKAEVFFSNFVKSQQKTKQFLGDDLWASQNLPFMEKLGKVYEIQHAGRKCAYLHCSLTVQARCLLPEGHPEYGLPDVVHNTIVFKTADEEIYCRAIELTSAPHPTSLESSTVEVLDHTGQPVNTIALPMHMPSIPGQRWLLLFFDPVLPVQSGPYTLTFDDLVQDGMSPLKRDGRDEMVWTVRNAKGPTKKVDFVLYVPKDFPAVKIVAKQSSSPSSAGRPMTRGELGSYRLITKYRRLGWTGTEVEPEQKFGVDVVLE